MAFAAIIFNYTIVYIEMCFTKLLNENKWKTCLCATSSDVEKVYGFFAYFPGVDYR